MSTGFLFPGQGSQRLEMLKNVPKSYLKTVHDITGFDMKETEESYQDTVFIQLALLTIEIYYANEMKKNGIMPDFVAGHSIGAFSAAVACGSLSFENAASLVYHRATFMKQAYPINYAMGVIVGLDRSEVQRIVDETFDDKYPVYISNENCPMQHTISGHVKGLEKTLSVAGKNRAQVAKLIKVPVPSHCELMDETVTKFTPYVKEVKLVEPQCMYLKNIDGRKTYDAEEIRKDLLTNIAHPVQWSSMMDVAKEMGMDLTIELPPGNTLTNLIFAKFGKDKDVRTINLDQYGIDDSLFLYEKWR